MRRARFVALLLALALTASAFAGPYEVALCPVTSGRFLMIEGRLWLEIFKQDGKPVEKRREQVANPLDEHSHDVLSKRGTVTVETHRDKKSGNVFVHWGTLKDGEQ